MLARKHERLAKNACKEAQAVVKNAGKEARAVVSNAGKEAAWQEGKNLTAGKEVAARKQVGKKAGNIPSLPGSRQLGSRWSMAGGSDAASGLRRRRRDAQLRLQLQNLAYQVRPR
jgi:hypothetical protein